MIREYNTVTISVRLFDTVVQSCHIFAVYDHVIPVAKSPRLFMCIPVIKVCITLYSVMSLIHKINNKIPLFYIRWWSYNRYVTSYQKRVTKGRGIEGVEGWRGERGKERRDKGDEESGENEVVVCYSNSACPEISVTDKMQSIFSIT